MWLSVPDDRCRATPAAVRGGRAACWNRAGSSGGSRSYQTRFHRGAGLASSRSAWDHKDEQQGPGRPGPPGERSRLGRQQGTAGDICFPAQAPPRKHLSSPWVLLPCRCCLGKAVLRTGRAKHRALPHPREQSWQVKDIQVNGVFCLLSTLLLLNELLGRATDKPGGRSVSCGIRMERGHTWSKRALAQLITGLREREKLQPLNTAVKG